MPKGQGYGRAYKIKESSAKKYDRAGKKSSGSYKKSMGKKSYKGRKR